MLSEGENFWKLTSEICRSIEKQPAAGENFWKLKLFKFGIDVNKTEEKPTKTDDFIGFGFGFGFWNFRNLGFGFGFGFKISEIPVSVSVSVSQKIIG